MAQRIRPAGFFGVRHAIFYCTSESPETGFSLIHQTHPFVNTDGGAIGPQHLTMPGHNESSIQNIFKRGHHAPVQGWPAQKHDPLPDFPFFNHPVQVVVHNGITKPRNQVFCVNTFLVVAHQIRFHEYRTPFSQLYRGIR